MIENLIKEVKEQIDYGILFIVAHFLSPDLYSVAIG